MNTESTHMKWKDETSFAQGEQDRTPRAWVARPGMLRVSVHRHRHFEGKWVLTCAPFFDLFELKSEAAKDAKAEGIALVREHLERALAESK